MLRWDSHFKIDVKCEVKVAYKRGFLISDLGGGGHQATQNWCPERHPKFHVDIGSDPGVTPKKSRECIKSLLRKVAV